MTIKDIDKLADALINASTAMEKAISILVKALPSKDTFEVLKEVEDGTGKKS